MILDEILEHKRQEVAERKRRRPEADMRSAAETSGPSRDFRAALRTPGISVIAEVKRASPAKGMIRLDADAAELAARYADAGAAAISVLTNERYFRGYDEDLVAVRCRVAAPVLRKEFIVEPYQVYESRAIGADAILLIVRALPPSVLCDLRDLAVQLGMAVVVEVHTEAEVETALDLGADVIGINNRDLTRMVVDLATTHRLRPLIPPGTIVMSESGIRSAADARALARMGVDAMLVGEALVTAADPGALIAGLLRAGARDAGVCAGA